MSGLPRLSDSAVERLCRVVAEPIADPPDPAEPDLAGTRYRLLGPLGRGGMAVVYRAHDEVLDREVAIKVLPRGEGGGGRGATAGRVGDEVVEAAGGIGGPGGLAARLRREARVLARLDHPGIVPVHDLGVLPDGRPFYAMKRVRGRRLDEVVAGRPPAPGEDGERLRVFERICEAVAFAHDRGVVHRDLKPENVMVGDFGEVLVMDWGVAKLLDGALDPPRAPAGPAAPAPPLPRAPAGAVTAHGTVLGTPGFMAPEQAAGEVGRHDRRVDVYALGALLAWLLTGRPPQPDAPPPAVGLPAPLASVVAKATAADAEQRYAGAGELAVEVARYRAALPVAAHPEGLVERLVRVAKKYRVAIALVLAYLVMRVLFAVFAGW